MTTTNTVKQTSTNLGSGQNILGNYRIGKNIGEGTFGKVKLGIHIFTQEKVAIKTLQKQKIIEQSDIERVTRQICILKTLRHPNIIQLYQIIQTKTDIHLIMQYAEGGELFDYIVKRKRLDEQEAVKFMQQIISGVEYIHKNGIVHRDLKPQNLLLDHNKNIKIVDFGLSNQYKPGEKLKTACGSPCYAAPQMISGKRYECLNVDIWSCGIILYAMLCGYLPFQDPNTNKLYKKIIAGDFQMPKILSSDAKEILKCILNVNPQTRYKIPQIRQSKWFNIIQSRYDQKGIIVGKDQIQPNEKIIKIMQKYNVDPVQARTYIINNRHNHATALYYLLQIKLSRQGKLNNDELKPQQLKPQKIQKPRESSPLIYRPDKKPDYYVSQRKPKQNKDNSKKDDSMNVSNIISSLVQANKNKLITNPVSKPVRKTQPFQKMQQFKLFPNKKNSSIYQPSSGSKVSTSRSKYDDKSFQFQRNSLVSSESPKVNFNSSFQHHYSKGSVQGRQTDRETNRQTTRSQVKEDEHSNKKRQELSDQLKQISIKIDQQILQLRKNNNPSSTTSYNQTKSKQTILNTNSIGSTQRKKSQSGSGISNSNGPWFNGSRQYLNHSKEMHQSHNSNSKDAVITRQPRDSMTRSGGQIKIHVGPFNAQCIFMENARSLINKISNYLMKSSIRYNQNEPYCLLMSDGEKISVQAIQGINGVHLVKFSCNSPLNQNLIQVLSR